jgi:hypothetical protein
MNFDNQDRQLWEYPASGKACIRPQPTQRDEYCASSPASWSIVVITLYAATPTMRFDRLINLDVQASVMKDMAVDDREGKVEVYASGGRDRAIGVMRRSLLAYVGTFRGSSSLSVKQASGGMEHA